MNAPNLYRPDPSASVPVVAVWPVSGPTATIREGESWGAYAAFAYREGSAIVELDATDQPLRAWRRPVHPAPTREEPEALTPAPRGGARLQTGPGEPRDQTPYMDVYRPKGGSR